MSGTSKGASDARNGYSSNADQVRDANERDNYRKAYEANKPKK